VTEKEIIKLFSLMTLTWPNAELFKGGVAKLTPTIQFWTSCLSDINYWIAQQAIFHLCKELTFPPTIADLRKESEAIVSDINEQIDNAMHDIRAGEILYGTLEDYYKNLPSESRIKTVIDVMGGPDRLVITTKFNGQNDSKWNWKSFKLAYKKLLFQEANFENKSKQPLLDTIKN